MFLNKLKILHSDTKSKNILYKKSNTLNGIEHYDVGNLSFNIPMNHYIFKIADFGAVQILGSTINTMTDAEIQQRINDKADLHELSRIWYRILVNYGRNDYGWNQIRPIVDSNAEYKQYSKNKKIKINNDLGHMPQKIRDSMLLRSLIYYGIENAFINADNIIAKYSLVKPSELVMKTLDGLMDPKINNVFKLFPMFWI
jgi:serine/threonine protein kinase